MNDTPVGENLVNKPDAVDFLSFAWRRQSKTVDYILAWREGLSRRSLNRHNSRNRHPLSGQYPLGSTSGLIKLALKSLALNQY